MNEIEQHFKNWKQSHVAPDDRSLGRGLYFWSGGYREDEEMVETTINELEEKNFDELVDAIHSELSVNGIDVEYDQIRSWLRENQKRLAGLLREEYEKSQQKSQQLPGGNRMEYKNRKTVVSAIYEAAKVGSFCLGPEGSPSQVRAVNAGFLEAAKECVRGGCPNVANELKRIADDRADDAGTELRDEWEEIGV